MQFQQTGTSRFGCFADLHSGTRMILFVHKLNPGIQKGGQHNEQPQHGTQNQGTS